TQNAHYYYDELRAVPIELPQVDPQNKMTFHQFVIRTEKRDALREHLQKNGIGTAIYYPLPLPLQPCFSYLGHKTGDFPEAEKCAQTCLALPIYPELTSEQLGMVVEAIQTFFQ
ncbi:MAG: transcriptional regulator, partial [Acidobacteria bacterium]